MQAKLGDILDTVGELPTEELLLLRDHLAATIAARQAKLGNGVHNDGGALPPNGRTARGWVEIKTINGHAYAYRRWYEGKRKRSKYLGKASEVISCAGN